MTNDFIRSHASERRTLRRWAWLLPVLLTPRGAGAEPSLLVPGRYDLAVQMVMPHLDEMRRIVTHAQRCVTSATPEVLFPVLEQPALGGCALGYPRHAPDHSDYVLVCASARVASGTATLTRQGDGVFGLLTVKMGGKNMTFSQRVEAHRVGACAAPAL